MTDESRLETDFSLKREIQLTYCKRIKIRRALTSGLLSKIPLGWREHVNFQALALKWGVPRFVDKSTSCSLKKIDHNSHCHWWNFETKFSFHRYQCSKVVTTPQWVIMPANAFVNKLIFALFAKAHTEQMSASEHYFSLSEKLSNPLTLILNKRFALNGSL